jgi:hypothetical protein
MGLVMFALSMNHTLVTVSGQFKYVNVFITSIYFVQRLDDSLAFLLVGNHCVSSSTQIKRSSRLSGEIWDIQSMHALGTLKLGFVTVMVLVEVNLLGGYQLYVSKII